MIAVAGAVGLLAAPAVRAAGPSVLAAVGCYKLEGLGSQLFHRITGDYFAILGLPLLPLLDFLRSHDAALR